MVAEGVFFACPSLPLSIQNLLHSCKKKFLASFYLFDSKLTVKKEPIDIKAIRQSLGFTQEDLARAMGLALSTVSKWEQGVTSPSRLAREKIERLLKKK